MGVAPYEAARAAARLMASSIVGLPFFAGSDGSEPLAGEPAMDFVPAPLAGRGSGVSGAESVLAEGLSRSANS